MKLSPIKYALAFLGFTAILASAEPAPETLTVTASRTAIDLNKTISSLSQIGHSDLQAISSVHINEAMYQVPGVWINRGNGQEHLTSIRSPTLTGAGSCGAFYIAEDGVATRATGFCNVNQLFDTNSEQAGNIEVLRGPGNELHGSNALHGVINVISLPPSEKPEHIVNFEGGPNDYGRISYTGSNNHGKHAYRLSINGAHDSGQKEESGYDQQKLTLRHDFKDGDLWVKNLLSATNLNQETAGYVEGDKAYEDDSNLDANPNPEAFRDTRSVRLQSRIEKTYDDDAQLIVTPYFRDTEMTFLMHFLPGTPQEENGQSSIGIQSAFSQNVSDKHRITTGFDSEFTDAYLKQNQEGGFSSFPTGKQYDYEVQALLLAAFINSNYQLSDNTRISSGLRNEYIEYDYDNRMADGGLAEDGSQCTNSFTGAVGCRYFRPSDSEDDFNNISVNIGILHDINEKFTVVSRLAHGFRAPQATELYRLQSGQTVADIDSEKIDSLEAGLRANHQTVSYKLTAFYMEKDNVIFQDANRQNIDDSKTEHYGLEYEASWNISDTIDLNIAGTYARHIYQEDISTPAPGAPTIIRSEGNDIDTAPRTMGAAQLGWSATKATRIELEWVHMGKYYTDIGNTRSYEGHDLFNLRLSHAFTESLKAGLRVKNLADENYAERADVTFGASDDRYFIGEPRSVFADVTYRF